MKKELKQELEAFLDDKKVKSKNDEPVVIETKTGLIERVDKTLVLADGRQLIREENFRDIL